MRLLPSVSPRLFTICQEATLLTLTDAQIIRSDWDAPLEIHKQDDQDILGYAMQQYEILPDGERVYFYTSDGVGAEFLQSFFNLTATEITAIHPNEQTLEHYGLDKPYIAADISWQNAANGTGSFSVRASAPDNGIVYVMNDSADIIYQINTVPISLTVDPNQLVSRYLYMPSINTVQELYLSIEGNGTDMSFDVTFTLTSQAGALLVSNGEKQIDTDAFRSFYQRLVSLQADEVYTNSDFSQTLPPQGTVRFTYTDGTSNQIQFFRLNDRKLLVTTDDERIFTMNQTKWNNVFDTNLF